MAVIFDQQQGQYVVNQKPVAPTAPIKPLKSDYLYGNNDLNKKQTEYNKAMDEYNQQKEIYDREKAEYDKLQVQKQTEEDRNELWAREDAIRKEVQEREDNALQRWAEDARKAGINPNLALGSQGSASGGGITNASGKDYTLQNTLIKGEIDKALADLERAFQKDENAKDRLNKIFTSFGLGALLKIK